MKHRGGGEITSALALVMFPPITLLLLRVLATTATLQRPRFTSSAPMLFMYGRALFWVKQAPILP